ncbi:MAG: hypothetical protein RBS07_07670 [Lentimicrobium sp.]|jgi:hypothetical protein|nr:hypothetical protein [Lentimicrobium sp.]
MVRYSLTSAAFEGEVIFTFNDSGLLESFDTSGASLSEKQQVFILKELPRELCEVKRVLGGSVSARLTEIKQEVTFEMFWNRYNDKRASRKKTEMKWDRMKSAERLRAYNFIARYENSIENWRGKMYATRYLNEELWNN